MSHDANYPFAYSKYKGQVLETKGRTNSNRQDFRHSCTVYGGNSKCYICEEIECKGDGGYCNLQLQGVNSTYMSENIPTVSDTSWAVGGKFRHDYGGNTTSHMCVMLTGGKCISPFTSNFTSCKTRCFGYGFSKPAVKVVAAERSVVDVYPGQFRWPDDGQVDLYNYPKNCDELQTMQNVACTYSGRYQKNPSFNPQGYAFTVAGTGKAGFVDGPRASARFNSPEDVTVDQYGNIFVADTKNHAIRMISRAGVVTTIAGKGPATPGNINGHCSNATFSSPKGVDVRYSKINGKAAIVLIVADTGNHRIRQIQYIPGTSYCQVQCFSGLCGNNTLSYSVTSFKAPPQSGYADGSYLESRFSSPSDVIFFQDKYVIVADTGNFLIRLLSIDNGTAYTLAGNVIPGERATDGTPLPGCTPPCMQGNPGYRDGNLTFAQFYNPVALTRGPNNTLWVVDEHRLRIVEMPNVITTYYGIHSEARVSTIAGTSLTGHDDGLAQLSTFYYSSGVYVDSRGVAYVSDAASCHLRRVTPFPLVSQQATCQSLITDFIRPSGCISYDPPLDKVGRKISRVEGNIQYNFAITDPTTADLPALSSSLSPSARPTVGPTASPTAALFAMDKDRGKYIKNCVGVPPIDKFDKHFVFQQGDNLVIDDHRVALDEDSEKGMAILVRCPVSCGLSPPPHPVVRGTGWYSEDSNVCLAALHDGKLHALPGRPHGLDEIIQVIVERFDYLAQYNLLAALSGTTRNGVTSTSINASSHTPRVFRIERYNISNSMVHTIAGSPNAPLEAVCGSKDGQPATAALFNYPGGMAARPNITHLSDKEYLYIADRNNHAIRALSAVCTFICENGGRCVADDVCQCATGWTGIDCATPVCSTACGLNKVCVAPNTCACKPGYSGTQCTTPLCQQKCLNGGFCSAPDTCSCRQGWFDTNCSTPVCALTCGNGGNCTAPNQCACPKQWTGDDCRTPVCQQTCLNNGTCVAPDTCQCPPQWTNYDCSAPICQQGYFEAFPGTTGAYFTVRTPSIPTFKNCDIQSWCNATNELECDQTAIDYLELEVPSGPLNRAVTGRKVKPKMCTEIELPTTFKIPYELVNADNSTTGNLRYSPFSPYQSNDGNGWRGYLDPTDGHTGPWTYTADRQVARVNWFNFSQGRYVCANGGSCVAPDICACASGWIGFDCRTPVCRQGYYEDHYTHYVLGEGTSDQYDIFEPYLNNETLLLTWPYSNPEYSIEREFYVNISYVKRQIEDFPKNTTYLGEVTYDFDTGYYEARHQGGYRCSIRAWTEWENESDPSNVFSHPNFFSQYMNRQVQADNVTYTFWEGFRWPPTHRKSRVLDYSDAALFNRTYAYTRLGWQRRGIWNRTENPWEFGICLLEFRRNCSTLSKTYDLYAKRTGKLTLDTDISFRPRIYYNDYRVVSKGRWKQAGGVCVDEVVRGCANNGTCVAPDTCQCAKGWAGADCKTPKCTQTCHHNGNCTSPDICTCERGWSGYDCSIPLCAQECQNGGTCVAPDTCQCFQFDNSFYDGRIAGGTPLFQDEDGSPLKTGWTGYDCSVPICVQAEKFVLNVASSSSTGYATYGGHGASGLLACTDSSTGLTLPRCPQYDYPLTGNDGTTWQTGCGYDPFDTGCCVYQPGNRVECYKCSSDLVVANNDTYYCAGAFTVSSGYQTETDRFSAFLDSNNNFKICGAYLAPRYYAVTTPVQDYGVAQFYVDVLNAEQSNYNFRSNLTSNRFLCHVTEWEQGDYIDDAGLSAITGVGSIYGLEKGRHIRINTPNIYKDAVSQEFTRGAKVRGEGIYVCYNSGSCLSPDICTCQDGYSGYDCSTPLCRHLQPSDKVTR